MKLSDLISALTDVRAYPNMPATVEIKQTHISVVFLAGDTVFKIKKPVDFGFLDFSTLEKREHFCREEVRLNRRLAPDVYLDVVPIVEKSDGVAIEQSGEPIEWAVKMRRLPDDRTLLHAINFKSLPVDAMKRIAHKLSHFYRLEPPERSHSFGGFEVVAGNARENFTQTQSHIGNSVSTSVFERVRNETEKHLEQHKSLIQARADAGKTRDTHGDLRLDHVYLFPEKQSPDDVSIIDCIEFNDRFRFADPIADAAFLVMDLRYRQRNDLATALVDSLIDETKDAEGAALFSLYVTYRAVVRAKVNGMKALEQEVPDAERTAALRSARAHWMLALAELSQPKNRPVLLLVGGLPGTGKTTLAKSISEKAGVEILRSDVVRKKLAGIAETESAGNEIDAGLYAPASRSQVYQDLLRHAEELLYQGKRVIVDASFQSNRWRHDFFALARRWCVPIKLFICTAPRETVKDRLDKRVGDASDANWQVYCNMESKWEPPDDELKDVTITIATDNGGEDDALHELKQMGVL